MCKRLLSVFFILMHLSFFSSAFSFTENDPEEIDILITEGGSSDGGRTHRGQQTIPFEVTYCSDYSYINLYVKYDIGVVNVYWRCLPTGEITQININATQGMHCLLMSGVAGDYMIVFTLSNGLVYTGSF